MDFRKRVRELQKLIKHPVLISHPNDVFYYSGYRVDDYAFMLVRKAGKPVLFLPQLAEGFRAKYANVKAFSHLKGLTGALPKKVGIDEYHLPAKVLREIKSKKVFCSKIIKKPREVKDSQELELMKKAIRINKKVLEGLSIFNKKEEQVAREIRKAILQKGAYPAFEPIVASGKNSGNYIHHFPGSRVVRRKEVALIDLGARFEGYCSDTTRMHVPAEKKKLFELVKEVQQECIDLVSAGVGFREIDSHYKNFLRKRRFRPRHGIGHGIGLSVHEPAEKLRAGMVITIEPGIYIKNSSGFRIEDMVLVKKNKGKVLSSSIPQLSVL